MAERTLADILRAAAEDLADAGSPSPRPEAERLVAHAIGCSWSALWSRLRDSADADLRRSIQMVVARRRGGEPLAYILGSVDFRGLHIEVGPGVLVPRPETEVVVDVVLALLDDLPAPTVVDVGTGSGAIALAVKAHRPDARVVALDRSRGALRYAAGNAARLRSGVHLVLGDLVGPIDRADVVVSNPPYVADGTELPRDVAAEPREALFAGPTGDETLLAIADDAGRVLRAGGSIVLEVGTPAQAERLSDRLSSWRAIGVEADLTGRPRVVWATRD